jgi:ABC-2 type transport system ATP-binding protein
VSVPARDPIMKNEVAPPMSQDSVVRLRNVRKVFGATVAVDQLTLRIARGEVFGLIGPNGAGKTTTFSMLAGYLRASEGSVDVLGYDPQNVDALRGRLGVLPQDAILPPNDTVGDFLVHMARLQGISAQRAFDEAKVVLGEVDGAPWWGMKCSALSHGMAKRVGIAQAFLGTPELVLLDEPTAGLDPKIAYEVRQIIKARKGRCTLVISSHNMHELEEMCDSAAILDHGRLVSAGSMAELTASSQEVRILVAAGPRPIDAVRALPMAKRVDWDEATGELVVHFERGGPDAEQVIGAVLWVLLNAQARISEVTKGRGLEQRVMELTG